MGVGFGGNAVFNRASPSSHPRCVAAIIADYLAHAGASARVLDIGGTERGFRSHAGCTVYIANPEAGVGADVDYVSNIPSTVPKFDLAMLFGVMMYIEPQPLTDLMRDVRQRLRGHGTLLVAEPDPEGVLGQMEVAAKKTYAAIRSLWDPTRFTFHTKAQTREMLQRAGFVTIRERPDLVPGFRDTMPLPAPSPRYFVMAASV